MPIEPTESEYAAALKKLHTDMTGVQGIDIPEGKRWLNTVDEVDGIVRYYTSEYLRRLKDLSDEFPWEALGKWVDAEASRLNHLFLGFPAEHSLYERGIWNTPDQLGASLRLSSRIDGEWRFAVRDAFLKHTYAVTDTYLAHKDDPVSEWGWKLDALMEDLTCGLLGIDNRDPELLEDDAPEL